jgi:hypothetical protein
LLRYRYGTLHICIFHYTVFKASLARSGVLSRFCGVQCHGDHLSGANFKGSYRNYMPPQSVMLATASRA